jgi:Second Messenger Oligonucleotide or Dinucleotide Synthetase domain
MTTTSEAFDGLNDKLNLDPKERAKAELFHRTLTGQLQTLQLIVSAFLQGSFARKTMIRPLRDIDKIMILPPSFASYRTEGGAHAVAAMFVAEIRKLYPSATVDVGRHSVTLDLGPNTFSFDMVPAFEGDDETSDVWIMDTKSGEWKRSNTRTLIKTISARNIACDGMWVRLVRQLKYLVREQVGVAIPGLHLEALAYILITQTCSYNDAMTKVLTEAGAILRSGYKDPTGAEQLSSKIPLTERNALADRFDVLGRCALRAQEHTRNGEHSKAIAIWHDIFGDCFTKPNLDARSALQKAFAGAGVARSGSLSHKVPQTPTRSWGNA